MTTPQSKRNYLSVYILFLFCLTLFVRIFLIHFYKSNPAGVDQNVVYGIQRVINNEALYQDPAKVPFAIMQYTPIYYQFMGRLCKFLHIPVSNVQAIYVATRTVSLLCNLLSILFVALTTHLWLGNLKKALVFALPVIMILTNHYLGRCDSMHLLFFCISVYLFCRYLRYKNMAPLLLAALFTACCILTKQSGILLPAILCFYLAFILRKWFTAIIYGALSVAFFAVLLWWLIGGDFTAFYQNAYLGLKNGFDYTFPLTIFISQFYYDLIPCYVLAFVLFYYFNKYTRDSSDTQRFFGWAMLLSFLFAVITGLKIGSSNNYFTEMLLFIVLAFPGIIDNGSAQLKLFTIRGKNITLKGYTTFCLVMLISSKVIGLFSSVFIERWFKEEKKLYISASQLHNYFMRELKLQPGQYIYFTERHFLDNIFFNQSLLPNKDVASQVYLANPNTINFSAFTRGMNKGLVKYIVTSEAHPELNMLREELPFVQFDSTVFHKMGSVYGYTIFHYGP